MSLMLDKKLIKVGDGEDENYKLNVSEFLKSRHINDAYSNNNSNTNTNTITNNNIKENIGNRGGKESSRIIINKYDVDTKNNSIVSDTNNGDYRTHFIRKFKENKSRISSRNQYSAIYVKQPSVDKAWNNSSNHNTSGSSSNSNLINDIRPMANNTSILSNNDITSFNSDSLITSVNETPKHVINSVEKWSSHINKAHTTTNNNTGVNSNSNNNDNMYKKLATHNNNNNQIKKQQPVTYNLLTHVITNPVERENTKESVNMQYDRPADINRDLIPTPHAYLKINDDILSHKLNSHDTNSNSTITPTFTTATLSSISTNLLSNSNIASTTTITNSNVNFDEYNTLREDMETPDNYVTINKPSKNISVYSRLTIPITNSSLSITNSSVTSTNNKINGINKKNSNKIARDNTNDSSYATRKNNTFSIVLSKNNNQIVNNKKQAPPIFRKKSISHSTEDILNNSNMISDVPSRSTSPIIEEPLSKTNNTIVSSRRSKNLQIAVPSKKPVITPPPHIQLQPQLLRQLEQFKATPRKSFKKGKNSRESIEKFPKPKFDPNNFELKEFQHCIITDLKIGEGEFGETFQGYRYDLGAPTKIAAKRLKNVKPNGEVDTMNILHSTVNQLNNPNITVANSATNENILAEVCVLSQLGHHEFVIEYLGVHTYSDTMYMVFEYAERGDLRKLLDHYRRNINGRNEININLVWKMKFAYEISNGMEYIASLGIVHKDLAARNILIHKDYTCKIADFGCCKADFIVKRPIRWMPPESLNKSLFTSASDVWSFGIVLWEIWTLGIIPYPGMTDDEVVSRINQWYRLYKPHECPSEIYNIMTLCWKEYYRARPRFSQIANKIKDLYEIVLEKGTLPV